jgi:hypothetical protein
MKTCPSCNRTYTDASLNFCLEDGTPLTAAAAPGFDPNATIRYTDARDTKAPEADIHRTPAPRANPPQYQPAPPMSSPGRAYGQQPQSYLTPPGAQPRKSNAIWWILGGILVLGVIVVGVAVMILALASMGSNTNTNANTNRTNTNRIANRNANTNANTTNVNSNTNTATLPAAVADDFSQAKWGTGNYAFGDIWYADDQYHMRAKAKTYLVMYAPSADFNTANATVRVTVRNVDGTPVESGYGLITHGEKSKSGQLEDYALLINPSNDGAKYQVIKHKGGVQSVVVPWTRSTTIRSGTNPNQLEIRAKGAELSFFINGQYVDRITDSEGFKGGVAGLYASDIADIAFDDLEIKR